jgi:hypothetical protein
METVNKFLNVLPVRERYCADCLSLLYGEPVESIGAYLRKTGIRSHPAHCRQCGEHKDTFGVRRSASE